MKWLVEVMPYYDVPASVKDDCDNAILRNGELCRFLRGFNGMLIGNDVDKIKFEQEIEDKVKELNDCYPAGSSILTNWVDINSTVSIEPFFKEYPIIGEFYEYSENDICEIVLYPVLNTYCPKGGEQ